MGDAQERRQKITQAAAEIRRLRRERAPGWQVEAGKVVWELCEETGLTTATQQELAKRLRDVTGATVGRWRARYEAQAGKPTPLQAARQRRQQTRKAGGR